MNNKLIFNFNTFNELNEYNDESNQSYYKILYNEITSGNFSTYNFMLNLDRYWDRLYDEHKLKIIYVLYENKIDSKYLDKIYSYLVLNKDLECCIEELLEIVIALKLIDTFKNFCKSDNLKYLNKYFDNNLHLIDGIFQEISDKIIYFEHDFINELLNTTYECNKKFNAYLTKIIIDYSGEDMHSYVKNLHFYDKNVYNEFLNNYIFYSKDVDFLKKEVKRVRYKKFINSATLRELIIDLMYKNHIKIKNKNNSDSKKLGETIDEIIITILESGMINIEIDNYVIVKNVIRYNFDNVFNYIIQKYDILNTVHDELLSVFVKIATEHNNIKSFTYFIPKFNNKEYKLKLIYRTIIRYNNYNLLRILFKLTNAGDYVDQHEVLLFAHENLDLELFNYFLTKYNIDPSFDNNELLNVSLLSNLHDLEFLKILMKYKSVTLNENNIDILKDFFKLYEKQIVRVRVLPINKLKIIMSNANFVESVKDLFSDKEFFNKEFIGDMFIKIPNYIYYIIDYLSPEIQNNIVEYIVYLIEKRHDIYKELSIYHLNILTKIFEVDNINDVREILSAL